MPDVEEAWRETADTFVRLGATFWKRYKEAVPDAGAAEVASALETIADTVDRSFSALGASVRDPQVREVSREAARSFIGALDVTFTQIGEALDQAFARVRETARPPAPQVDDDED
jgi:Flp pilus assembly pilin Flp